MCFGTNPAFFFLGFILPTKSFSSATRQCFITFINFSYVDNKTRMKSVRERSEERESVCINFTYVQCKRSFSNECGYKELRACSVFLVEDMYETIDSLPTHVCFLDKTQVIPPSLIFHFVIFCL